MKKVISLFITMAIVVTPLFSTNCFAFWGFGESKEASTPVTNISSNAAKTDTQNKKGTTAANKAAANKTDANTNKGKSFKDFLTKENVINGLKITALATMAVLTGSYVIDRLDLSEPIGKGFRFFVDYIAKTASRLPVVLRRMYRSFSQPSEVFVAGPYEVSCLGAEGSNQSWLKKYLPWSKQNDCLCELYKKPRSVYNENIDLFSDPTARYDLVFKRN